MTTVVPPINFKIKNKNKLKKERENRKPRNVRDFWIWPRLRTGKPKGQGGKGAEGDGEEGGNWGGGLQGFLCPAQIAVKLTQLRERPHRYVKVFLAEHQLQLSKPKASTQGCSMHSLPQLCPNATEILYNGNGARVLIS